MKKTVLLLLAATLMGGGALLVHNQKQSSDVNLPKSLAKEASVAKTTSSATTQTESPLVADLEQLETLEDISDYAVLYSNPYEIAAFSQSMLKGTVLETETRAVKIGDATPRPMTIVKVQPERDFKNKDGDQKPIYYVESGGIIRVGDLNIPLKDGETGNETDPDKLIEVTQNGAGVSKTGDKVIFFGNLAMEDIYGLDLGENYYLSTTGPTGRFYLDATDDVYKPKTTDDTASTRSQMLIPNDTELLQKIAANQPE